MSYIDCYLNPIYLRDHLARIKLLLKDTEFDAIACRGASGMAVAPMVAIEYNKPILLVRKPKEDTHAFDWHDGLISAGTTVVNKYIIVDDMVHSGATVKAIVNQMAKEYPDAKCQGVYCYTPGRFYVQGVITDRGEFKVFAVNNSLEGI